MVLPNFNNQIEENMENELNIYTHRPVQLLSETEEGEVWFLTTDVSICEWFSIRYIVQLIFVISYITGGGTVRWFANMTMLTQLFAWLLRKQLRLCWRPRRPERLRRFELNRLIELDLWIELNLRIELARRAGSYILILEFKARQRRAMKIRRKHCFYWTFCF